MFFIENVRKLKIDAKANIKLFQFLGLSSKMCLKKLSTIWELFWKLNKTILIDNKFFTEFLLEIWTYVFEQTEADDRHGEATRIFSQARWSS